MFQTCSSWSLEGLLGGLEHQHRFVAYWSLCHHCWVWKCPRSSLQRVGVVEEFRLSQDRHSSSETEPWSLAAEVPSLSPGTAWQEAGFFSEVPLSALFEHRVMGL